MSTPCDPPPPVPPSTGSLGKLLEGDVDELPDLTEAEHVMDRRGMGESAGRGRAPAAGSVRDGVRATGGGGGKPSKARRPKRILGLKTPSRFGFGSPRVRGSPGIGYCSSCLGPVEHRFPGTLQYPACPWLERQTISGSLWDFGGFTLRVSSYLLGT